jgi:hypothetical protein
MLLIYLASLYICSAVETVSYRNYWTHGIQEKFEMLKFDLLIGHYQLTCIKIAPKTPKKTKFQKVVFQKSVIKSQTG